MLPHAPREVYDHCCLAYGGGNNLRALIMEPGLDVSVVPYLYDLDPDHTGRLFLESVQGDMVVLGWMFPRAAFWVLDRDGIKGFYGESQLKPPAEEDEDGEEN